MKYILVQIGILVFSMVVLVSAAPVFAAPAPTVNITANGSNGTLSIGYGDSIGLEWTSTNAAKCIVSPNINPFQTNGSAWVSYITSNRTYSIQCTGTGGTVSDSVNVIITGGKSATLRVNGSDSSITVRENARVSLSWDAPDALSCGISPSVTPSGYNVSGNILVAPGATSKTYTLECTNYDGTVTRDSVTVNVDTVGTLNPTQYNPPVNHPQNYGVYVRVDTNRTHLDPNSGQNAVISWNTQNVTNCVATGGWSGSRAAYGSETVFPNFTYTYTLSCKGGNQTYSDSATVTVGNTTTPPSPVQSAALDIQYTVRNTTTKEGSFSELTQGQGLDNLEFEIRVKNTASSDATQVMVGTTIPDELFYVPASTVIDAIPVADGLASGGVLIGSLAPGEEVVVTFSAVIFFDVEDGTIYPQASVSSGAAVQSGNDTAQVTILNRGQVLGAATVTTGPENMGIIVTFGALVVALIVYIVFFVIRESKNMQAAGTNLQLRAKILAARIRERGPDV